jgi:branched-subunit amino acid aminotransferase/4-amino-4-deoxychorismate lyase
MDPPAICLPRSVQQLVLADGVIGDVVRFGDRTVPRDVFMAAAGAAADGDEGGAAAEPTIVYDSVRVINGQLLSVAAHLNRLRGSVVLSDAAATGEANRLRAAAAADFAFLLQAHGNLSEQNIKVNCWRRADGGGRYDHCTYYIKAAYPAAERYRDGVPVTVLRDAQRHTVNAKTVQQPLRQRAVAQMRDRGAFEALLLQPDGVVPEGAHSNYFIIDAAGVVKTAPDDVALVGVALLTFVEACRRLGVPVVRAPLRLADVAGAAAAALMRTSVHVLPISAVDGAALPSAAHPLMQRIIREFDAVVRSDLS